MLWMENKNYHIVVTLLWKCCERKRELPQCYNFVMKMLAMKNKITTMLQLCYENDEVQ